MKIKDFPTAADMDGEPDFRVTQGHIMEVSSIANLATSMSEARTGQEVAVAVLRKTMDIQGAVAMAMINAVTHSPSSTANLPAHLGNHVNTRA